MCRHVVWPLRPVDIALAVFWSDCFEKVFEIRLNIRIGVFLNEKRGRRMAAEYRQKAARNILPPEPKRDFAADFNEAFGRRLDVQRMKCLPHGMTEAGSAVYIDYRCREDASAAKPAPLALAWQYRLPGALVNRNRLKKQP
jgi:hypothetical protein